MADTTTSPLRSLAANAALPRPAAHPRIRMLAGAAEARRAAEQIFADARREQVVCLPGTAGGERVEWLHAVVDQALRRNVQTRRLATLSSLTDVELGYLREAAARGLHARVLQEMATPYLIVDRRVALVFFGRQEVSDRVALVTEPVTVGLFAEMFERDWLIAADLPDGSAGPGTSLSVRQREIANLLAGGHTDESVARRLGVSVRTVRAEVAAIRDALGSVSRFQAGVRYAALRR